MNADLQSATDAGSFVFCDASFREGGIHTNAAILEAVKSGRALLYSAGGDVDIRVRVIVGEAVPPTFLLHVAAAEAKRLLRLPTGLLVVCGVEDCQTPPPGVASCRLPAGNYRLDAYLLEWGEEAGARATTASEQVLKGRVTGRFRRMQNALGCLALACLFGGLPALWISFRHFGRVVGIVTTAVLGMMWLALWLLPKFYPEQNQAATDALHAAERVKSEFPDVVLHLERLPDEADLSLWKGGHLRPAHRCAP